MVICRERFARNLIATIGAFKFTAQTTNDLRHLRKYDGHKDKDRTYISLSLLPSIKIERLSIKPQANATIG